MRIIELVESRDQIDEITAGGVGQGIGKAAGSVVQGAGNFFKGIKQGYKAARTPATPDAPASGAQPAANAAPATNAVPAVDVDQIKSQIAQKQQEIKSLQSQITKTEPGIGQAANTVSGTATNTPQPQAAAPTETPPTEPGIGQAANTVAATATNTAPPADPAGRIDPTLDPAAQIVGKGGSKFNQETGKPFASQAEADAQDDEIAAASAAQKSAPVAPGAAPAGKLSAKDQNSLKARLKAKQGTAAKTQTGFNQYVQGGGGSTLQGADAKGNPVFKQNVQREGVEFYSNFLGRML